MSSPAFVILMLKINDLKTWEMLSRGFQLKTRQINHEIVVVKLNWLTSSSFLIAFSNIAVQAKNSPCIKMLLRKGAKINRKIYTGASVLNHAAETGQLDLLVYLLRHRAKLNVFEDFHIGPIFLAARGGHYECLQVLLQVAEERGTWQLIFIHIDRDYIQEICCLVWNVAVNQRRQANELGEILLSITSRGGLMMLPDFC